MIYVFSASTYSSKACTPCGVMRQIVQGFLPLKVLRTAGKKLRRQLKKLPKSHENFISSLEMCISNLEMYISNLGIYIFRLEIEFSSGNGNFFYGIRRLFARDSGKSYALPASMSQPQAYNPHTYL